MMQRPRLNSLSTHSTSRLGCRLLCPAIALAACVLWTPAAQAQSEKLLSQLNAPWVRLTDAAKSSTRLFTTYIDMTSPPMEVGEDFNQTTIYPGMEGWSDVRDWALANAIMGKTLIELENCQVLGVPYGTEGVDARFVERGLVAVIAPGGDLTKVEFPYFRALESISAYVTADMYRLCEDGAFDDAFKVGLAHLRVLRQACDAQMFDEKVAAMTLLADAMSVHRDVLYTYRDKFSLEVLKQLSMKQYPYLKATDDQRLKRIAMPEGDLWLAMELLESVFDDNGQVNESVFGTTFSGMQAREAPLTGFGAVKRWERVAGVHGSLEASRVKLNAVYDDWWRRWRMREYDPLMALPTEFSVLNPVKYAGVAFSARDIDQLFGLRRRLVAEFCGLVVGCGLVAYRDQYSDWPNAIKMAYSEIFPKRFDFDPYDREYGAFRYEYLGSRTRGIETATERVEASGCLLYAVNDDNVSNNAARHAEGGNLGDFVLWPPIRSLMREQAQ
jgi:hypothetical protein